MDRRKTNGHWTKVIRKAHFSFGELTIEYPSLKHAVYQVWLKLVQKVLRRSKNCEKFKNDKIFFIRKSSLKLKGNKGNNGKGTSL